jgi:2-polyprenyl-3-methyl-5-hydroxy-6-metoxy-1,4-benzoquinol methylase
MLMELIAPKVKSYIGVDFSEPFIDAANTKKEELSIENAEFVCSDINVFCNDHHNTFDIAFAMDISEHVYDSDWKQILISIRRSLKPNAKLYLHTPNADFFLEKMKNKNFLVKQFPAHIAVRTPKHNAQIIKDAGLEIENIWLLPHYNSLKFIHLISYIPVLGKYFKARILIEAKKTY